MKWREIMWNKIKEFFKNRGATLRKYKYSLYLFLSVMLVVGIVNIFGLAPHLAIIITMGLGVLKQWLWDVKLHNQKFDWIDLMWMVAGCAFGLIFTGAWYKLN